MAPDGRGEGRQVRQVPADQRVREASRPGGDKARRARPPRVHRGLRVRNAYLTFAPTTTSVTCSGIRWCCAGWTSRGSCSRPTGPRRGRWGGTGPTFAGGHHRDARPAAGPDLVLSLHVIPPPTTPSRGRSSGGAKLRAQRPVLPARAPAQAARPGGQPTAPRRCTRYGILAERPGRRLDRYATGADAAASAGYRCDVVQFVTSEHTAKNVMIRATRTGRTGDAGRWSWTSTCGLRDFLGVTPYLERFLGASSRSPWRRAPEPTNSWPD